MPSYKELMPSLNPLQNTIRKLTDFTLPNQDLRNFRDRSRQEAATATAPQREALQGTRRILDQQRTQQLNAIQRNRSLLPQWFQQNLKQTASQVRQQEAKRGVASSGVGLMNILQAGQAPLQQQAQGLQELIGQQGQMEGNYLNQLLSQVFGPQRELAVQQGAEATKRYQTYINQAQESLFQGRVQDAERLLNEAQLEYNALIQQQEGRLLQEQMGYQKMLTEEQQRYAQNLPGLATQGVKLSDAAIQAHQMASQLGLRLTSGYRDPKKNAAVGGSKKSKHMQGLAYDFSGSKKAMDQFAKWAKSSGLFDQVLWQVPGHYDHVHVSWKAPSSGGSGGKVDDWLTQAIRITGVPMSWLPHLRTIAMKESSGNPRAINKWDSNAKRGTPSKGLMQTIDPTFSRYKIKGYDDIYNPVHNAIAAINYIKSRYGTVTNVPGIKSMAAGGKYRGY
ncbi:hypothetical protein DCC39_10305 [Pueribacillus theae]|uniref:Peptidase M15 n=1 Tax=Pueribacillus theae TaxID=2171751 RepID=A0A2U1K0T3_9BACI|nr:hypothetical protein DCC39_10305 [Pueribacillus theae]